MYHHLSRVNTGSGASSLLAASEPIAGTEAGLFDADSVPCAPTSADDKRGEIERGPHYCVHRLIPAPVEDPYTVTLVQTRKGGEDE